MDRGFLSITLTEYQELTPFQVLAFRIAENEIHKWRSKNKPLITY